MKIFSTDHKAIARAYLFFSLAMLLLGGAMAMLMRWQLAFPGKPLPLIGGFFPESFVSGGVILPDFYHALFTIHATLMIFFAVIPLLVNAFGYFLIPLQIGAGEMAFPKLSAISFWLLPPGAGIILAGFFTEGGAAKSGWTAYAPLSVHEPAGQTLWIIGILFVGLSSLFSAVNILVTILNMRAPGMTFFRMPLTIWAQLVTAVISVLATPVLASALVLLLLDRIAGTHFFLAPGGEPILWQHLFWFYSHPAVYIMILPGMGMISDILAIHARKPVFGYRSMVYAMMSIAFLGFIVWGHHMFQSGMNPALGTTFMVSTFLIAVPSGIKTFNWLATLWRGKIRFNPPMLYAAGFVSLFVTGGLSGIFMSSAPVDMYIHDTYFIVAHIHYVLFGGSLFAVFAALTHWYPKMFGRMMDPALSKTHFILTFLSFNATFFPMHFLGIGGMMRRLYDTTQYAHLAHLQPLNIWISLSAFCLGASQFIFLGNFLGSLVWGKKSEANPWQANTLEWTVSSPPPSGNFEKTPEIYRGPYEYSVPGSTQDWIPQDQKSKELK